jgi:hypothetical protein
VPTVGKRYRVRVAEKAAVLSNVRVEGPRLAWYKRAHNLAKGLRPGLTWSTWVRDALDGQARAVTGQEPPPCSSHQAATACVSASESDGQPDT